MCFAFSMAAHHSGGFHIAEDWPITFFLPVFGGSLNFIHNYQRHLKGNPKLNFISICKSSEKGHFCGIAGVFCSGNCYLVFMLCGFSEIGVT